MRRLYRVVSDSIRHLTEAPLSNTHGTAEYTRQVFGAMMLIGAPVLVVYLALWAVLAPQRMDRLGFGLEGADRQSAEACRTRYCSR